MYATHDLTVTSFEWIHCVTDGRTDRQTDGRVTHSWSRSSIYERDKSEYLHVLYYIPDKEIFTLNEFSQCPRTKQFVERNRKLKFQRQPKHVVVAVNHLLMPRVSVGVNATKPRLKTLHCIRCTIVAQTRFIVIIIIIIITTLWSKNVTCFYFTVVSTNVDQFLQYVDILLINAWMDGWMDRWIWHVVYRVNLLHNLVTRLTCLLLLYYLGGNWCLHLPAWQCARIACTCLRIALILIQFTVKYWAWCRIQWIRCELKTWPIDARCKALSTVLLMNGVRDFRPLWMKKEASWTLAVISRLKCTTTVYTN